VRNAAFGLVLAPVVVSVAGIAAIVLGHSTTGIALLVGGIVLRGILYVTARWQERSANRNAKPS
jgi:hypothetical protein